MTTTALAVTVLTAVKVCLNGNFFAAPNLKASLATLKEGMTRDRPSAVFDTPRTLVISLAISANRPVGSLKFTGSPKQYAYGFNPPRPNGLKLSGQLNLISTGLNARCPLPSK
ncbi:hypothetical protein D3C81_1327020 [compost metagenome]